MNEDGARFSLEHAAERLRATSSSPAWAARSSSRPCMDRPELVEAMDERQQVGAHDTRSTFIPVALANRRSETRIADRTRHRGSVVTRGAAEPPGRLQSWALAS
ncbi:hypothetical protein [Sorangium sp. So ce887]|uniref:hypothetical protein n=1 Tax=Sorangium sp. So ce887 TaxID=3133324 RepID=UPI003F626618